jgi:hypothetical protein
VLAVSLVLDVALLTSHEDSASEYWTNAALVSVPSSLSDRGFDAETICVVLLKANCLRCEWPPIENALDHLQAPFDHVDHALADVLCPGIAEAPQGTFDEEHG